MSNHCRRPVSYTHLDVYKRQAGGRPSKCPDLEKLNTLYCEFSAREIAEFYGVSVRTAVSYTHLDVYKRQVRTVRGWVYRARKKVKEEVARNGRTAER